MINFVYFDVGGVVIKDFSNTNGWEKMLTDLGIKPKEVDHVVHIIKESQEKFDVGSDFDNLAPFLSKEAGIEIPEGYSLLGDLVGRFEKNPSIWPIIELVSKKVGVGLLTNMYPRMLSVIIQRGILPPVKWSAIVDSSIEKCWKPELKIFEIAQTKYKAKPEEILFVDNTENNLEVPKKMGWQTYLYDSGDYEGSSKKLLEFVKEKI